MKKLNDLFYSFLQVAASTQKLGMRCSGSADRAE